MQKCMMVIFIAIEQLFNKKTKFFEEPLVYAKSQIWNIEYINELLFPCKVLLQCHFFKVTLVSTVEDRIWSRKIHLIHLIHLRYSKSRREGKGGSRCIFSLRGINCECQCDHGWKAGGTKLCWLQTHAWFSWTASLHIRQRWSRDENTLFTSRKECKHRRMKTNSLLRLSEDGEWAQAEKEQDDQSYMTVAENRENNLKTLCSMATRQGKR